MKAALLLALALAGCQSAESAPFQTCDAELRKLAPTPATYKVTWQHVVERKPIAFDEFTEKLRRDVAERKARLGELAEQDRVALAQDQKLLTDYGGRKELYDSTPKAKAVTVVTEFSTEDASGSSAGHFGYCTLTGDDRGTVFEASLLSREIGERFKVLDPATKS